MAKGGRADLADHLTMREASFPVLDRRGRHIGAVIRSGAGLFVGWTKKRRVGDFQSPHEAERAVKRADAAKLREEEALRRPPG
jgi:hypothetical protein